MDEPITGFHIAHDLPLNVGVWFERREAARFALYKWEEFLSLTDGQQAGVIAHYRLHNRIEALSSEYQTNKASRRIK